MDNKEKIINDVPKEIEAQVLENEINDVSIPDKSIQDKLTPDNTPDNTQFPKNPSLPKESDFSNEKVVKEKQGKTLKKDVFSNNININSYNINNHDINNSLNDISTNNFNNLNTSYNNINSSFNNINLSYQQNTSINNQEDILKGKEESLQQVVRVNINDLYRNQPVMNEQRAITIQVPKSLEDWIENHSKKALENPISPETPPSYIPVLETTEDLDEIITPKRSVSCRARNHNNVRQIKTINQSQSLLPPINHNNINNSMNHNSINYNSMNHSINHSSRNNSSSYRKHQISRQSQMIYLSDHEHFPHRSQGNISIDTESLRRLQKGIPKFQMCSYKQCEFIATDRCEKCYDPLCLNHVKRFYYTIHMFSGKNLCINCFRKMARSYLWFYLSIGIFATVVLIVTITNSDFRNKVNYIHKYIIYFILSVISLFSFYLTHHCSSLVNASITSPPTY
ncbi:hypothetical protein BCR36DRAFT_401553 [Piromyces finnis]|uniref:Uncharacterized protein n=1 Tax=Piromyces finnis TaxID=1754191 RepID=A0A1Y1VMI3_9FUNG|nr:hypothetical protein BCR36DRAFT_401553 [Piromyces finnis]|eukprot:ORX59989.1 hypothetical protein BCR36DRAFT_401553 [Piromyces finnis]